MIPCWCLGADAALGQALVFRVFEGERLKFFTVSVTLAALPLSIFYNRPRRVAPEFGGGSAPALGLRTGRREAGPQGERPCAPCDVTPGGRAAEKREAGG